MDQKNPRYPNGISLVTYLVQAYFSVKLLSKYYFSTKEWQLSALLAPLKDNLITFGCVSNVRRFLPSTHTILRWQLILFNELPRADGGQAHTSHVISRVGSQLIHLLLAHLAK